jgi:hypothetical protein
VLKRAQVPVLGPLEIHRWSKPFEDDVQDMLGKFLTFEEALASAEFGLMNRQRLQLVRDRVFGALQQLLRSAFEEAVDVA